MFRYIIQLPFALRFEKEQGFALETSQAVVKIQFVTLERNEGAPWPNTHVVIDSNQEMGAPDWAVHAFWYVNDIIRAYQIVTKNTYNNGVITPLTSDMFFKSILCLEIDEKGATKNEPKTLYMCRGVENKAISKPEYDKIKRLAKSPKLIANRYLDEILVQARTLLQQENYAIAILEAVIGLESALSSLVKKMTKKRKIPEDKIKRLTSSVGISQMLDVVLGLLDPNNLPPKEIIEACKKANRIRNDIVHEALIDVPRNEAEKAVGFIDAFVEHYRKLKLLDI